MGGCSILYWLARLGWDDVVYFENVPSDSELVGCSPAPRAQCLSGFTRGLLDVDERRAGAEKLRLQLSHGPALGQDDFGNPMEANGTAYAACIYDHAGALRASIEVDRAGDLCGRKPCWKSIGGPPPIGRGYRYKDPSAEAGGIRTLELKGGVPGKSKISLNAANKAKKSQLALKPGIANSLIEAVSVTVQVLSSDSQCVEAILDEVMRQDRAQFRAE